MLVAVIDTGIDYTNSEFIYEDNTSKILYLWDQSDESGESSQCFGREYTNEDINRALKDVYKRQMLQSLLLQRLSTL